MGSIMRTNPLVIHVQGRRTDFEAVSNAAISLAINAGVKAIMACCIEGLALKSSISNPPFNAEIRFFMSFCVWILPV